MPAWAGTAFMTLGASTVAPIGHRMLCTERPSECRAATPVPGPALDLDLPTIHRVAAINTAVNAAIKPKSDQALFGVEERWAYPVSEGDCEDYVLLKRLRLHEAGIALSNLLITVVRKPDGEGHAVLTLRTREGDFVLDNLDWRVKAWRDTPYTFVKRQDSSDPAKWLAITEETEVVVGALDK